MPLITKRPSSRTTLSAALWSVPSGYPKNKNPDACAKARSASVLARGASMFAVLLAILPGDNLAQDGIRVPDNPEHAWMAPLASQSLLVAIQKVGDRIIAVGERGHVLYGYREDKAPERTARANTHPASVLARSASLKVGDRIIAVGERGHVLYGYREDKAPERTARANTHPASVLARSASLKVGDRIIAVGERGHVLYGYREDKAPERTARANTHPASVLARSASLYRQGVAWRQAEVPTQRLLTGLSFTDERHGFATGHDGIILATADGGRTWRKVHEAAREGRPLLDIGFLNRRIGIAVGAYGYLLRTQDGGETWHPGLVRQDHDYHLDAIAITKGGRIYLAAEAGYVYRSDDQGRTWRTLHPPYDGSFFGIHAMDDQRLVVFGLRGRLFASRDGGEIWQSLPVGGAPSVTSATLTSATRLDDGRILLTGHAGTLLLVNPDSWQIRHTRLPERRALSGAVEIVPNRVLVVGEGGIQSVDLGKVFP